MKRQVPDWEKMLADPKSDKGPASQNKQGTPEIRD